MHVNIGVGILIHGFGVINQGCTLTHSDLTRPQRGDKNDGELESLALEKGHDLDGLRIAFQPRFKGVVRFP